jgi:hypothetical protein
MAKRCPSCGYGPIGPFSDNCPICAEPVRNVRSRDGIFGTTAIRWILGGVVVATLAIGGCCGIGMWQFRNAVNDMQANLANVRAEIEADRQNRKIVVSAAELLREFEEESNAADLKYVGKYLEVTGVVERVGRGKYDTPFAIVYGGIEKAKLRIECFFDMYEVGDDRRLGSMRKDQPITFRGEYDGIISNIQIRECVLVR